MGQDFKCGCRLSFGKWFLCKEHEGELISKLEVDTSFPFEECKKCFMFIDGKCESSYFKEGEPCPYADGKNPY